MRKTLLLAVLSLSTTLTASARADKDSLISPLKLGSTAPSTGKVAAESRPRPLSNASAVQTLLLATGYTARIDERETIRIELSRGDWTAPVFIGLADAGRQLRMAMRLTEPEANTVIATGTLRGMLQANRSHWGAFFAITGQPQRIELVKILSNNGLDSELLGEELDQLAEMAEKSRDIWKAEGVRIRQSTTESESTELTDTTTTAPATTQTAATSTPAATTTTEPAAAATQSLTGKWIATPTTNEAFALQVETDSRFKLVHVKGTKSTKSKGTWTLAGTTLTLKGDDGTTISGTVTRKSDSFTLSIAGTGGKSFELTFKSGS